MKKKSVLFGAVLLALVLGMFSCSNLIEELRGKTAQEQQQNTIPTYTVTIAEITNGTVTADKASEKKGETVTLAITPRDGYELDTLTVKDADNNAISTTEVTAGTTYTFVMPEDNVTVSAAFKLLIPADFVKINGGTFDGKSTLTPSSGIFISGRSVTINNFYMCSHEVTQKEYEAYCTYGGSSPSDTYGKGDDNPAYYVSWYDALVYCNRRSMAEGLTPCYTIGGKTNPDDWGTVPASSNATWNEADCNWNASGYRLPTEAEWEYAARNENRDSYTYSGRNTVGDVAWYTNNSYSLGSSHPDYGSHSVKTKTPNGKGLYDMSGNVWEWCWDRYGSITSSTAACGASSSSYRVRRGGSWHGNADSCSVSYRNCNNPYDRYDFLGFRLVRSAN